MWAEDGGSLAEASAEEELGAGETGLIGPGVDGVEELSGALCAAGVGVVAERAATGCDCAGEDEADGAGEGGELRLGERAGVRVRIDAGAEERFIGVDVADAGEGGLIEEERFDGAVRILARAGKIACGDGECVGAEGGPAVLIERALGWIGREATKAAGIDEEEERAAGEFP